MLQSGSSVPFIEQLDVKNLLSFPGGSDDKDLPVKQETQVQYLGWEDPLEKATTTHSCILVWRIPWTEEPGSL